MAGARVRSVHAPRRRPRRPVTHAGVSPEPVRRPERGQRTTKRIRRSRRPAPPRRRGRPRLGAGPGSRRVSPALRRGRSVGARVLTAGRRRPPVEVEVGQRGCIPGPVQWHRPRVVRRECGSRPVDTGRPLEIRRPMPSPQVRAARRGRRGGGPASVDRAHRSRGYRVAATTTVTRPAWSRCGVRGDDVPASGARAAPARISGRGDNLQSTRYPPVARRADDGAVIRARRVGRARPWTSTSGRGQAMGCDPVPAGHRLGGDQGVQDRLLGRLDTPSNRPPMTWSLTDRTSTVRRGSAANTVFGRFRLPSREADEQVAARVSAGPAHPGDAEAGPLGQPLALVGSSGASVATTTMIDPEPAGCAVAARPRPRRVRARHLRSRKRVADRDAVDPQPSRRP